jgi:hypothetical protein
MAVDHAGVVDIFSRAKNGDCVLTISDHLEWGDDGSRLLVLQEKLNRYLAFIESGELLEKFPDTQGSRVIIQVYFMHAPNHDGLKFLGLAQKAIENAGFGFEYKMLPD